MKTAKKFFSLEGIDGSGKSTQIDMLVRVLESEGHKVVRLREPGGAKISERIRELLLDPAFKGIMADDTELLLYNAARAQACRFVWTFRNRQCLRGWKISSQFS